MSQLEATFPKLTDAGYAVTSPRTFEYNCIAWAGDDDTKWWWPDAMGLGYWPAGVPRTEDIGAFEAAYATLGYRRCSDGDPERGYEKVAIFGTSPSQVTHAARQLQSGAWTSKLGALEDVTHNAVGGVSGNAYGDVIAYLRRPRST